MDKSINSLIAWLVTAFVVVMTIIISSVSIYSISSFNESSLNSLKTEVYNNNKDTIKYETQIAINILQQYYNRQLSGELTKEQAKSKAANIIRNLRYGDTGYFFIYDTTGNTVVLLGGELESSNRMNEISKDGSPYIKNIIDAAVNSPSGDYTSIMYPKPSGAEEESKLVFSQLFTPYNWVIGTGIYTNDLEEQAKIRNNDNTAKYHRAILLIIILSLILCVFTFFTTKKLAIVISKPLSHIANRMYRISVGDLDKTHDDIFSDTIFKDSLNEFAQLNKASNTITTNLNNTVDFIKKSISKISTISNNLNNIYANSAESTKNINETINKSFQIYEFELDSIEVLHAMIQKDKASLSTIRTNLTNVHTSLFGYTDNIKIIKESVNKICTYMNTIKDRNSNAAFSIKEISTDYDRINSTINIVSNLILQSNIYITNILDAVNKKDSNYDIANDISTIRDLNIRSQDNLNTLRAITVGIINTYKNINSSITAETDGLEAAFNSTGVITAILDSDLSKNNNSCNEISNIVSEMNHIVYDLNIYYIALEEMNDKIKDINKEVKLVVQYSDDVNDNMNQISEFIVQLGELVQKINNGLVYKK